MLFQLHIEKFTNQIRKRQRSEMIKQIRNKIYSAPTFSQGQQANKSWQVFLEKPSTQVPWLVVQNFQYLSFDNKALPKIINELLDPVYLINVIFVSRCALMCEINSVQFFKKALDVIQPKENTEFQSIMRLTHLKHHQQIYIDLFINSLQNLSEKQIFQVQYVLKLEKYFIDYWNKYVDEKQLNYKLCALMIAKLFVFHQHIEKLCSLVNGMLSVLIQEDTSPQTYWLVCVTFRHNPDIAINLLFNHQFPEFLYSGVKQEAIKDTLRILQAVVENDSYFEKLNVNYLTFLKKMYQLFMTTTHGQIQKDLLFGFYNLTFLQAEEAQQFYLKIDYDEMFEKCSYANLLDFLDFCLSAMYNYPLPQVFQHILFGNSLRLIDQICRMDNFGQNHWRLAKDLYQALEQGVNKGVLTQAIGIKAQQMAKKLENVDWTDEKLSKIKKQEKQLIIDKYCTLIDECQ